MRDFVLTRSVSLEEALEDAWRRVEQSNVPWASDDDATGAHLILAKHIIIMAKGGERDARWLADSDSGLRRTFDTAANDRGVVFNHSIITNQFSSLFDFVSRGLGIAIVPASAVPPSNESSIMVKPLRPAMTRRIGIIRLAERSLTPASQEFLKIFQPKFLAATTRRTIWR